MSSNSTPGLTWYELLGVAQDAPADEIKRAWRDATDKFEPGSGTSQFRLFNEAADVLLNPERRAAYDAELAGAGPATVEAEPEPPADEAAVEVPVLDEPVAETPEVVVPVDAGDEEAADAGPDAEPTPAVDESEAPKGTGLLARLDRSFVWVALICAPIIIAAVVLAAVTHHSASEKVDTWEAGKEAAATADRALTSVLGYDYRKMDSDEERAVRFLTPEYAKKFKKTFSLLTTGPDGEVGPAVKTKTVVSADVLGTGVMDAEPDRVRVVAFVNQAATKGEASPSIFQNRVVVTMVRRGDTWLIDDVKTY
jgi:Mce-associated membrane protein